MITATPAGYVTGGEDGVLMLWPGLDDPGDPRRVARVPGQVDRHARHARWRPGDRRDHRGRLAGRCHGRPGPADRDRQPARRGGRAHAGPLHHARRVDGSLQRWSAGSPSPTPVEVDGSPWALAVSPDGSLLAVAGDDGLHVLRLGEGDAVAFSAPVSQARRDVAWSADGRAPRRGRRRRLREGLHQERAAALPHGGARGARSPRSGSSDPARSRAWGRDGTVRRWDASAGVEQQLRGRVPAPAGGVAFDGDSRITLVGADGSAESWRPGSPGTRPLLPAVPGGSVYSADAQGDLVAVGLFGGRVIVRDRSGAEVASADLPARAGERRGAGSPRSAGRRRALRRGRRRDRPDARRQPADRRASRGPGVRRRLQPGRRDDRQRRQRRHGEGLGRARRLADARHPRRAR